MPTFSYRGPNAQKVGEVPRMGTTYWQTVVIDARSFSGTLCGQFHCHLSKDTKMDVGWDDTENTVEEYSEAVLLGLKNYFNQ